jgi:hypothetical protein
LETNGGTDEPGFSLRPISIGLSPLCVSPSTILSPGVMLGTKPLQSGRFGHNISKINISHYLIHLQIITEVDGSFSAVGAQKWNQKRPWGGLIARRTWLLRRH